MIFLTPYIPLFPLLGFLVLALFGKSVSKFVVATIGVGSIALSALFSLIVTYDFLRSPVPEHFRFVLWKWMEVAGFHSEIAFFLDSLSLVMITVVTVVALLIHLYSAEFMREEEGYSRFFAYMNLFVASMLVLVLADDLVVLLLGWEGVGLCSYLLIGFWYENPANGAAARKAFVVTRVGDTSMLLGLLVLFHALGTLRIDELLRLATGNFSNGGAIVTVSTLLLLGGAVGKSAQLPLQVWLPDAMAGPSPVSALIHAATMVTAGVYLIARLYPLFTLSPDVQFLVGIVGAVTLLVAGSSALVTRDLKRALAYSTISQVGYMFLALGVGAWTAAIFHFATHAFFKSLLFLAAGVVIAALDDEHDIFRMGGLRRSLPLVFWTFLAGAASLSALPFITAGFYSKDLILDAAWREPRGMALLICGLLGSFLTALYSFRLVFLVFFGEEHSASRLEMGNGIRIPLVVLAFFSLFAGFGRRFLNQTEGTPFEDLTLALIPLLGLGVAYWAYVAKRKSVESWLRESALLRSIQQFWLAGWGFDWLYDRLFVQPFLLFSRWNKDDFLDAMYQGLAIVSETLYGFLSFTQSGLVRTYVVGLAIGALLVTFVMVFL